MKHLLTFLRHGVSGTLASTVGSPSAHRRGTMLKHYALMLMFLLGSLNVWGELSSPSACVFSASPSQTTLNDDNTDVTWTSSTAPSSFESASPARGLQWGGTVVGGDDGLTLSCVSYTGKTITKIEIVWSRNNNAGATLTAKVGGADFDDAQSITGSKPSNAKSTFNGSASGNIEIKATSTATGNSFYVKSITVTFSDGGSSNPTACAEPTFSPTAGAVVSGTTVELNTTTEGATIHYTTNGVDPTTSDATYSTPIEITSETTIKAIAVKAGLENSDVASAAYTILEPKTIAQIMPTSETEGDAFLLNDVTVTYAYGSNVYVKDATGYMMVFSSIAGAANGKVLQGLQGKAKLYNGLPEISSVIQAPTVNDGSTVDPEDLDAYPTDADLNKYVTLEGVTFASAASLSGSVTYVTGTFDGSDLILRNTFKLDGVSLATEKSYRIVGVVQKYNSDYQVYPITIEEIVEVGAPETPVFSVAAGTYTEVQNVTITCATEGATIYYTTNGDTPDNTSTEYTAAISVGENMTIKAIAIKDAKSSRVAEAAYVINLPEDENVRKTWDLSTDSYDADPTEDLIQWSATYVSMKNERTGTETAVNNYIPTAKTSTRFYSGNKLTITPSGKQITSVVFTATTEDYATALQNSDWGNATATASGTTVTVIPTDGIIGIIAKIGETCGFTAVQVNYGPIDPSIPEAPTMTWYTSDAKTATIAAGATYTINLGDAFAPVFETNSSGTRTYSSNNDAVATINASTGALALQGGTGDVLITCTVAEDAVNNYAAGSQSFTLRVLQGATVDYVVILAQYNGSWYAMKNTGVTDSKAEAIEVAYSEGKVWNLSTPDQEAITWKRTVNGGKVTFQAPNGDYLKTSNKDLALEAGETGIYQWTLSEGYYHTGTQTRTFIYRAGTVNAFKSYAVSNAGTSDYSALPVVTAAVFATTPEVIRGELSAGKWGTLCPKQTVEEVEGATFYQISYLEEQGGLPYKVVFDEISGTTLTAGQPYFFIANATEIRGIKSGDAVTSGSHVNGFYGYISPSAASMELTNWHTDYDGTAAYNTFVIYDNSVYRINQGGTMLKSERCYININPDEPSRNIISPAPGRRRIVMGVQNTNTTTGMDELNVSEAPRKMIIDGKMYIFRGEKMYDAKGQLVK